MVNYESHLGEKTGNNKEMTKADQPLEKLKEAEVNFQIDRNETKFRKETEEIRVNDVYDNIESYLQTDDANDDVEDEDNIDQSNDTFAVPSVEIAKNSIITTTALVAHNNSQISSSNIPH